LANTAAGADELFLQARKKITLVRVGAPLQKVEDQLDLVVREIRTSSEVTTFVLSALAKKCANSFASESI
jgi:hypothetical protein